MLAAVSPGALILGSRPFVVQGVDSEQFLSLHRNYGEFWVWVPYTDVNGGQGVIARLHLTRVKAGGSWTFHKIHYFRFDEEVAFAEVTFDAATLERAQ